MKKFLSILILILILLNISACNKDEEVIKTITYEDLEMEIPNTYREESLSGYDRVYSDDKSSMYIIREGKNDNKRLKDLNLDQYTDLIREANSQENKNVEFIGDTPSFSFTFESKENENTYVYLISLYESKDAFYIIQNSTTEGDYGKLKGNFIDIIRSVKIK